jgi:mannose-1-phosphate guanylyltransferase
MNSYVVIMAGGSGERFWPMSRIRRPKQLLALTRPDATMIEEAIARIEPLVPKERILIITSEVLREPIAAALPGLPVENVIAEPAKRNTAPCLALACSVIEAREQGPALMAVLTADHFIGDAAAFRTDVSTALSFAETTDALVTLGIPPTRPETGYGYIHVQGAPARGTVVKVDEFKEKPNYETALEYVVSGSYLWNSGMFFWRTSTLRAAMAQALPDVARLVDPMRACIENADAAGLAEQFGRMPDISIDFGVMERAPNVYVLPASFPWDDVGSWDALERMHERDDRDNVTQGDVVCVDTSGSVLVNAHGADHTLTTVGVDGIVVVVTPDATMVCAKDRAQDVKTIVAELRRRGRNGLL